MYNVFFSTYKNNQHVRAITLLMVSHEYIAVVVFTLLMLVCSGALFAVARTHLLVDATLALPKNTFPNKAPVPAIAGLELPPTSQCATHTLRRCNKQSDCSTCTEPNMACVLAEPGSKASVNNPSLKSCSGHGTLDASTNTCVCDCEGDTCFSGANCETMEVRTQTAERVCVPDNMLRCDPYTSLTVLTPYGWRCECREDMLGLFVQDVEGGNCNVPVACGDGAVSALVNVGTLDAPVFAQQTVQPNHITSATSPYVACVYPTVQDGTTDVQPHPDKDPRCHPILHSNRCDVHAGGYNTTVVRGSGLPDDPERRRVWPPFGPPVPPNLGCPASYTGKGTQSNPCVHADTQDTLVLYSDNLREWVHPQYNSVNALRQVWNNTTWPNLPPTDLTCLGALPSSTNLCVDDTCTAARGSMRDTWISQRDGELQQPACVCNQPGTLNVGNELNCVADACSSGGISGMYDNTNNTCSCNVRPPRPDALTTSRTFNRPLFPPVCVEDSCNPHGVWFDGKDTSCSTADDCEGVCFNHQCYLRFPTSAQPNNGNGCTSDLECSALLSDMDDVRCVDGKCVLRDPTRAYMGSLCDEHADCSLGNCVDGACAGACACKKGYKQTSDGGLSTLGLTCVDACIGYCLNGGTCSIDASGLPTCTCTPYFGGDRCETRLCAREGEYCNSPLYPNAVDAKVKFDANLPPVLCCSECPCGQSTRGCCNRFPRESTVTSDPSKTMQCVDHVCTVVPQMTQNCSKYFWKMPDGTLVEPNVGEQKPSNALVSYASLPPGNVITRGNADQYCPDGIWNLNIGSGVAYWNTKPTPPCNGYGRLDENGACVCFKNRTGAQCETALCASSKETCEVNTDCCNFCPCSPEDKHCCDMYDPTRPLTQCENGVCVEKSGLAGLDFRAYNCKDAETGSCIPVEPNRCSGWGTATTTSNGTVQKCEGETLFLSCSGGHLVIDSANYGTNCGSGTCTGQDVTQSLQSLIGTPSSVQLIGTSSSVTINPNEYNLKLGTDPCPGQLKRIEVNYRCETCTCFGGRYGTSCEYAVCNRGDEDYAAGQRCTTSADCCNFCPCDSYECCDTYDITRSPMVCEAGKCVVGYDDFNIWSCYDYNGVCLDKPEIQCSGWGTKEADGSCTCFGKRFGTNCENAMCIRGEDDYNAGMWCFSSADCCNFCPCDTKECCEAFDDRYPNMICSSEGKCVAGDDTTNLWECYNTNGTCFDPFSLATVFLVSHTLYDKEWRLEGTGGTVQMRWHFNTTSDSSYPPGYTDADVNRDALNAVSGNVWGLKSVFTIQDSVVNGSYNKFTVLQFQSKFHTYDNCTMNVCIKEVGSTTSSSFWQYYRFIVSWRQIAIDPYRQSQTSWIYMGFREGYVPYFNFSDTSWSLNLNYRTSSTDIGSDYYDLSLYNAGTTNNDFLNLKRT